MGDATECDANAAKKTWIREKVAGFMDSRERQKSLAENHLHRDKGALMVSANGQCLGWAAFSHKLVSWHILVVIGIGTIHKYSPSPSVSSLERLQASLVMSIFRKRAQVE